MSNLDCIKNLHQSLEVLKTIIGKLDLDISNLIMCITGEKFIPDALGEHIIEKITRINGLQKEIEEQFVSLEIGALPSRLKELNDLLEECEKNIEAIGKYTEAVDFFMTLQSDDEQTQALLDKRKKHLAALDFSEMDEELLKENAECYVWLSDAFHETNPVQKFSLVYKLAGNFEESIAREIQFGTLRIAEKPTNTEEILQPEEPEEMVGLSEKNSAAAENEDIWKQIGIDDPSAVIFKEDKSLLKVELSPKNSSKFSVKEFKKDIAKQAPVEKIICLTEAFRDCGYSKESIALQGARERGFYDFVSDKLMQLGYLKKYIVKGFGEFFTLSSRGEKAFLSRDSLSFINHGFKNKINLNMGGERIEDSTNSAITRILYHSCYGRTLKINSKCTFNKRINCISTNYFFAKFPDMSAGKSVVYIGIVSEEAEQFKKVYDHILEIMEDTDEYIVLAATHETASAISKWVSKITEKKPVWYCGFTDTELFDAESDAVAEINAISETDAAPDPEEPETQLQSAGTDEISADSETAQEMDFPNWTPFTASTTSEENRNNCDEEYQKMLISGKFYAAAAYIKALAKEIPYYETVYSQLAYALNDPMENCSYNSDTIFHIYYNEENPVSDYFIVSAAIRNYFYDQFSYDYSLQQLQTMVSGNPILKKFPAVDKIVYTLQQFKTENHRGVDRYADYREKERASWEIHLEEVKREAKDYYDNYCAENVKENTSNKRFIETEKLLLGPESDLSEYLKVVIQDDRGMSDLLEDFLSQNYIKDYAVICKENIEPAKINKVLDSHWNMAAQNMRFAKKSSTLMSSLRMNLFKRINKIVSVLCNYVFLVKTAIPSDDDPAFGEYKKIRSHLLEDIHSAMDSLKENADGSLHDSAGNTVLTETLREMKARVKGSYREENYKYFYINFLRNDKVLLDDDFLPVLDDIPELPEFSARSRIIQHCREKDKKWEDRLREIWNGEDDYGSAELIFKYLKSQDITLENTDYQSFSIEKAIVFPQKDMENKREGFIEDLELAQSYGQIDNTAENIKETILQIVESWYIWAGETKNFGFFTKILAAFTKKIHDDAEVRAVELNEKLAIYLEKKSSWKKDSLIADTVEQIKDRIKQQNYAAAEDLLNRLLTNDLDFETDLQQTDYLLEFFDEYDVNYRRTANSGTTLKSLVHTPKINKDTKGANRLLENWPRGTGFAENTLRLLLAALGFTPDTVKAEPLSQGKIENYFVTLKRPKNGKKSNYKHPISAFGSEAEEKGFRVVCVFGKSDASRLIDTFKEIGDAKNTIVLLDYALTLADRRKLARKTKTDLRGKIFAVIDRVVLVYLANHYTETAINRMLMSVIMPFASYQPYIDKSADVMPQEIFIGRKNELEKIESPTGVNIVYGGRQLGKTALLRMAKKDIDMDENGDRAVIVNAWKKDYCETAKAISTALYDEGVLKEENITEDWDELARDIKNRLRDPADPIPYLLLMIDEADVFIESCEDIDYQPFDALKDIQGIGSGRFKFVVAGLRNIVRFKRTTALRNNSVLTHFDSLTVKPFKSMEARELLEVPLSYLGFRFPKDNETEALVSTIFGTTNYFPGLIQLYCTKLIEAVKRDYAGYSESETPPYFVRKDHIKKVLAEESLQHDIREKFFITLKVGEDDYYYIIALLAAYYYHENRSQNGCNAQNLLELADTFSIGKITALSAEKITALMEEMQELNVLQHTGDGYYWFTRYSFYQMMGTLQQIDDELLKYMEG